MKRYLLLGLFLLSAALWAAPFTIVEMTDTDIVLRFELPRWTLDDTPDGRGMEINAPGAFALAEEGKPVVPYYHEMIGLPVNGSFTVELSDVLQETRRDVDLRPGVTMILADNGDVRYVERRDRRAYRLDALYPARPVMQSEPAFMGDHRFAGFQICPFQYNAARRELIVTSAATVHIHISGDTSPTPGWEATTAMLHEQGGFFLNDNFSRKWRRQPQQTTNATQTRSSDVQEIQIIVDEDGIYKITYAMLADSIYTWEDSTDYNMAWNINQIDPRNLELYDENGVVPVHFEGESDGSFDQGDFIEFYGKRHAGDEGYYDEYTSENVYRLRLTDSPGARMAVENGGLEVNDPSLYTVPRAYEQTVHFEEQNVKSRLGDFHQNPREDLWFWGIIAAPSMEIVEFNLQYPYPSTIRGFEANVMLMGSTHLDSLPGDVPDHHAEVRLNSTIIGNKEWFRQTEQPFANEDFIANTQLHHGVNTLYISLPGDIPTGLDQVFLDYLDLKYWREYKTDEDFIEFTKPAYRPNGLYQFELDNFSTSDVSIYKIGASVMENLQVEPFSELGGAPWKVSFQDYINSNDVTYYAVTESAKKTPRRMQMNIPSELKTIDHQCNYIIITAQRFMGCEGLELYEQTWNEYGQQFTGKNVQVEVVAVEDIFDEFSHGIRDAQAIRDFLSFAYNNWNYGGSTGRVEYVLLLGDGMMDERDDSPWRKGNIIPNKYVWTEKFGATAADNWYASVVGPDQVGDIAIGRICLYREEEILIVANKLRHYIENPLADDLWHSHITLAAGGKPDDEIPEVFALQSEGIRSADIPAAMNVTRVYTVTQTVSPVFLGSTFTLLDQIEAGTSYLQFMGHGGGQVWADHNLLRTRNIASLANDKYPLVLSLACYCSQYDDFGASSIGEAFVLAEDKGAIGHLGFSGLGYLREDFDFGSWMNEALFEKDIRIVGDAINYVKASVNASGINSDIKKAFTQGCLYIGDPLVRIWLPTGQTEVTLNEYSVDEGDVVQAHGEFSSDATVAMMQVVDEKDVIQNTPYPLPVAGGALDQVYQVPNTSEDAYKRYVRVFAANETSESIGYTMYTVGMTAVMNVRTLPETPSENDSVYVLADFHYQTGIDSVICVWHSSITPEDSTSVTMRYDEQLQSYVAQEAIPPYDAGRLVSWRFHIYLTGEPEYLSEYFNYYVLGPDLKISSVLLGENNPGPTIDALLLNDGTSATPQWSLRLYQVLGEDEQVLLEDLSLAPLQPGEHVEKTLPIPVESGTLRLRIVLNEDRDFSELTYNTNDLTYQFYMNMIYLSPDVSELSSTDGNVDCEFPVGVIPEGTIASLSMVGNLTPVHQPGIEPILMASGFSASSVAYEVTLLDSTVFADSTGLLPGGATMRLKFHYAAPDSLDVWGDEADFGIYRWNEEFQKWIYQGGQVSLDDRVVVKDVTRCGVYTMYRNKDEAIPNIDANVEEQEFSYGGYVSGKGTISFILSDDNGIDVIDNPPLIYLDGVETPQNELHISASLGQLINTPIKYQLDLDKGDYTLIISCSDVNGNYAEKHIPFTVNTEFSVLHLANYPNPVLGVTIEPVNEGRTRFTYVLTDDADEVNLKIYTVSGRLVKTFDNLPTSVGYHEYPRTVYGWDCRDDDGVFLANGVYFYRLTAKRGGKTVEKTEKMAILR